MQEFPEEYELLALFECEPTFLDTPSDTMVFFYNEATYEFSNGFEDFIVTLQPACGDVKIQVTNHDTKNLMTYLELKNIARFEIINDKKDVSSIMLTIEDDERLQTFEIDFKPNFKLITKIV